ncbi:MAG: cadherin-like beta sandwich domain-containing protein [Tannerella sp.]|jgi:hypothetical protein|nr:cadherin-like beta sandwich domain-containing protein [Tannerella sp.]
MPVFYNKVERGNPANPSIPKLWYPVLKSTGLVKERDVARLLAEETTLNPKEAEDELTVSPASLSFGADGGTRQITVGGNVSWTVICDADWISIGIVSGSANVTAVANPLTGARSTTVVFSGGSLTQTVSVTQSGFNQPPPVPSSDGTLSALSLSGGVTLSPAFDPGVTSYQATVPYATASVTLTAVPNHAGSSVSGAGMHSLTVGENVFNLTVTAEDGNRESYVIIIVREGNAAGIEAIEAPAVRITAVYDLTGRLVAKAPAGAVIEWRDLPKGRALILVTESGKRLKAMVAE